MNAKHMSFNRSVCGQKKPKVKATMRRPLDRRDSVFTECLYLQALKFRKTALSHTFVLSKAKTN